MQKIIENLERSLFINFDCGALCLDTCVHILAPWPPQSLIPEACQYKPSSAASIGRQLLQIRKTTPYLQVHKPEPFDKLNKENKTS